MVGWYVVKDVTTHPMKKRYESRPAPWASAIAAVVGILMIIFVVANVAPKVKPDPTPFGHPKADSTGEVFMVVWIMIAICIVGYHVLNAIGGAPPTEVIESVDEEKPARSVEDRLKELAELRSRDLISEAEYETKRQEILKEV